MSALPAAPSQSGSEFLTIFSPPKLLKDELCVPSLYVTYRHTQPVWLQGDLRAGNTNPSSYKQPCAPPAPQIYPDLSTRLAE